MGDVLRRAVAGAIGAVVGVAIVVGGGVTLRGPDAAIAADASQFDAGNIVSDEVFYNSSRMSADEIQAFLNAKETSCAAGYTCLRDYRDDMISRPNRPEGCTALPAASGISAAQIIWRVAVSCGINPQAILVLLEKEQGLVSSSAPSAGRYRIAAGYGCPDTAACDSQYYGFSNQVWNAARQFRAYRYYPASFNYRAGRDNTIRWSPDASCGASTVYIANQATAGLYNYTPYRPNQAALSNLYGRGDSCSSYGNRNFWRTFTDWFGSTTVSSPLVQGPGSLQIWLIGNGVKYPINNPDVYYALATLGPVVGVGQRYLDDLPTGHEATRLISDPSGNLFYADSGNRYHFDSCQRITDWGFGCSTSSWTTLTDGAVAALTLRGEITNAGIDPSGRYWRISGGTRAQAADQESMVAAGETENLTALSEPGIARLQIAAPIVRPDVVLKSRDSNSYWLTTAGTTKTVGADLIESGSLAGLPLRTLLPESVAFLGSSSATTGLWTAGSGDYLLTTTGRVLVGSPSVVGISPTTVSPSTLNAIPMSSVETVLSDPVYLRAVGLPTVYRVSLDGRRAVPDPAALARLGSPTVLVVASSVATAAADRGTWVFPGTVVRVVDSPRAYLADTPGRLIPVDSYQITAELGFGSSASLVADATVSTAQIDSQSLSRVVTCGETTVRQIGLGGTLRPATDAVASAFASATTALSSATCSSTTSSPASASRYLRDPSGAVWYVVDGTRRYVPSMAVLSQLGGSASTITDVSAASLLTLPVAAPLVSADLTKAPTFVRAIGGAKVYLLSGGARSWILTPGDLVAAQSGAVDQTVYVYPDNVIAALPEGSAYLRSGMTVRATEGPAVYLIDGSTKWYVGNGETVRALGASAVRVVPDSDLTGFALGTGDLSPIVNCYGTTSIGLGGTVYPLTGASAAAYSVSALAVTTLVDATCARLPIASGPPSDLLRGPDGRVYRLESGSARWVTSPSALTRLAGPNPQVIDVTSYTLGLFPVGAPIS